MDNSTSDPLEAGRDLGACITKETRPMHRWVHLSILVHFISTILIVLGIFLGLSGCSSKREIKERSADKTRDAGDAENPRDDGEKSADGSGDNNDEEDGRSEYPSSRDAGNDQESRGRQDAEGATDSGEPGDDQNNDRPDSSDTGIDNNNGTHTPVIDIPYEDLQELPNTSARACNPGGYSPSNPIAFASCEDICPNASCVPNMMLSFAGGPEGMENLFLPCDAENSCVPDHLIGTLGAVQYKKCRSIGNMEGVCIWLCNNNTASTLSAEYLPQDSCHENEVCVPCYDPIRGGLTAFNPCGNYISSSCNGGATESGIVFEKCCDGNGTCIPGLADVNPDITQLLGKDSCQGEDELCLPRLFGMANYRPARCETDKGAEGRCLSECISPSTAQQFTRSDCAVNELCVPCTIDGSPTGACTINDDEPGMGGDL